MPVQGESPRGAIEKYNAFVMRYWKRNLWLHVADGVFYSVGLAFAQPDTILPGFIRDTAAAAELGAYANRLVGVLPFVMASCFIMPQLLTAKMAEGRALLKKPMLIFAFIERLPWLFMGVMTSLVAREHPVAALYLFMAFIFMYQFDIGLVYPLWAEFVAKTMPVRRRGLLFGIREGIGGVLGFAVLFAGRPFVARLGYPSNYAALFFACFAAFMISYVPLFFLKEAPAPLDRKGHSMREHFRGLWATVRRDSALMRYLACRWVHGLVAVAAPAFFVMRAVSVLGEKETVTLTVKLAMVTMLARAIISVIVGPLGDRFGYKVVLAVGSFASAAAITAALLAQSVSGFYLAYALATFAHMSFWLGRGNYVLELAPLERRPSYISIDHVAGLPLVVVPFFGGWLADRFGYTIPFSIGVVLALAAGVMFLSVAVDPRQKMRTDLVA